MTPLVPHFEETDDWTPQLPPTKGQKYMTTTSLTRVEMIGAIKLRDPNFDPTSHSDDYLSGRYEATVAAHPLVSVPDGAPAAKLDEADHLSPVTRAQISAENERDRVRTAVSLPPRTKRLDDADHEGLSAVTKAQILAHDCVESQRNGGFGGGPDAA